MTKNLSRRLASAAAFDTHVVATLLFRDRALAASSVTLDLVLQWLGKTARSACAGDACRRNQSRLAAEPERTATDTIW